MSPDRAWEKYEGGPTASRYDAMRQIEARHQLGSLSATSRFKLATRPVLTYADEKATVTAKTTKI